MKMKKILAMISAFAVSASVLSAFPAFAAEGEGPVEGAAITLAYEGSDSGLEAVSVTVDIAETLDAQLVKYSAKSGKYSGKTIAGFTVEIPIPEGLSFDYDASFEAIEDADLLEDIVENNGVIILNFTATSAAKGYYGTLGKLVTLYFAVDDDEKAPFTVTVANGTYSAMIQINTWAGDSNKNPTIYKYVTENFTITPATIGEETPATEYVTVTTDGNVEGVADGQVEKGSKIAVSAKEVAGKTAKLYANGEEIVDGAEYTFDADVSFTVVYEDIVAPATYTYSFANAGYKEGKTADKEDVFYKLNINTIAEGAKALVATVAEKDFSVPLAAPVVEGAADVEFTFVFVGVPVSVFGTDTILEKFTAFGTDNQEYVKADAQ